MMWDDFDEVPPHTFTYFTPKDLNWTASITPSAKRQSPGTTTPGATNTRSSPNNVPSFTNTTTSSVPNATAPSGNASISASPPKNTTKGNSSASGSKKGDKNGGSDEDSSENGEDNEEEEKYENPYVYDFFNPPRNAVISEGCAGIQVIADNRSFPFIGWDQVAMGVQVVAPCGLEQPHLHPAARELMLLISGEVYTGFIRRNEAPLIINFLRPGMATFFKRGAIHFVANLRCEPAFYVSAFDNSQMDRLDVSQNFFRLPTDIIRPSLGYPHPIMIEDIRAHVPQNFTAGLDACLIRCGLA